MSVATTPCAAVGVAVIGVTATGVAVGGVAVIGAVVGGAVIGVVVVDMPAGVVVTLGAIGVRFDVGVGVGRAAPTTTTVGWADSHAASASTISGRVNGARTRKGTSLHTGSEDTVSHRRHAEIENAIGDLKYGGRAQPPTIRALRRQRRMARRLGHRPQPRTMDARNGLGEQVVTTKTMQYGLLAPAEDSFVPLRARLCH